jgi:hypothetical protein
MYNILYKGRVIHKDLTLEECTEVLDEYSQKYYEGDDNIDITELELEEI